MHAPCGRRPPRYRLPERAHPGAVHLQVSDLERSLAWYREVLGCALLHRDAFVARLGTGTGEPPLIVLHELAGARPVPAEGRLGLYHFAILLPDRSDLGAFLRHLARAGLAAGMSDHHVSEALYLADPDGLGIEVYADRPRSHWRCHDGELHMTTGSLDADALVDAATAPWQGLPPGTSIGHLHLFVGDLAAASAFYHQALGFDQMVWSYPGALFFAAGGYHHHLGTNTWARHARPAGPTDARLLEWSLVLPQPEDVQQAAASLAAAGFEVSGDDRHAATLDPWGTRLLIESLG